MITIINVIILGVIEGLTEFLPISSTGHLILAQQYLPIGDKAFENAFGVIIQLGAIFSVLYLYFDELNPISKNKIKNASNMSLKERFKNRDLSTMRLIAKIIVGFFPAAVLGFLFDDLIDQYLFNKVTVAIALIFFGIVMIFMEKRNVEFKFENLDDISLKTAFLIGCFQCLAMIPGTSRSAATIIGAMALGCSRTSAAKFSFFLAIPTMLGATCLKLLKTGFMLGAYKLFLIFLGGIVSYIVAIIVIRKFLAFIRSHDFVPFGIYRILLGTVVLITYFMGVK